jgi:hypothetical protein
MGPADRARQRNKTKKHAHGFMGSSFVKDHVSNSLPAFPNLSYFGQFELINVANTYVYAINVP